VSGHAVYRAVHNLGLNGHGFSLACPVLYGNDLPVAVGNHDLSKVPFDEQASTSLRRLKANGTLSPPHCRGLSLPPPCGRGLGQRSLLTPRRMKNSESKRRGLFSIGHCAG
jgi:hypothetical protein